MTLRPMADRTERRQCCKCRELARRPESDDRQRLQLPRDVHHRQRRLLDVAVVRLLASAAGHRDARQRHDDDGQDSRCAVTSISGMYST